MKYALAIILSTVWVYLMGAFVLLNFNPTMWSQEARELAAQYLCLLSVFSCIWVAFENRKPYYWRL